ncbi:MAG: helix-turn-helix domain-containing protein [Acidobacteria bacterium]|nr:helix-turn-helix domain-containing protein [Acidobacteriota bacterium]
MGEREDFGPSLRSARLQRGIPLQQIVRATKVGAELWEALERSDLSRWPTGLYARACVRAYALEVGLDPQTTVDEFCRCFPAGDRRAGRAIRDQAALIGHQSRYADDRPGGEDERRTAAPPEAAPAVLGRGGRPLAAVVDTTMVVLLATAASALLRIGWATAAAGCALVYHAVSLVALGCTPAAWLVDTYLASRYPSARTVSAHRFLRLVRHSPHP